MPTNPFRSPRPLEAPHFLGRGDEIARIRKALLAPRTRLLVHGPRRMGKTSTLHLARTGAEGRGGAVLLADLSTASAVADVANRLLAGVPSLGGSWTDPLGELVNRLGLSVRLDPDPGTGKPVPSLDPGVRRRDEEAQWQILGRILDILDRMAHRGSRTLAVVLDEFQTLLEVGGPDAEARLRAAVRGHRNLSYVLVGAAPGALEPLREGRPLYRLFGTLALGALNRDALARWIDGRMEAGARARPGLGEACVTLAGPRTGDVVRLAGVCYDLAAEEPEGLAEAGSRRLVQESQHLYHALWRDLTPYQQNVLRAVAGADRGLTTSDTLDRFALGHSGSAFNAAAALVDDERLVRADTPSGYDFEDPFFGGWVVENALADVGIRMDRTVSVTDRGVVVRASRDKAPPVKPLGRRPGALKRFLEEREEG